MSVNVENRGMDKREYGRADSDMESGWYAMAGISERVAR